MTDVIEQKEKASRITDRPGFVIELVFKNPDIGWKLSDEERQLLHSCIGEILGEIEVEEKRIIEEERLAAHEITARNNSKQEG